MKFSVVAAFIVIVLFSVILFHKSNKRLSFNEKLWYHNRNYSVDNLISVYGGALCLERIKQQLKQRQVMI